MIVNEDLHRRLLMGNIKRDTTLRTPVDSWYEEVHKLKKEMAAGAL